MPTNNLSLTLGPGREEEEEEKDWHEEKETGSVRTKCPARRENGKYGQSRRQKDGGVKKARESKTQRKTMSALDHLEALLSTILFSSSKQALKMKYCREHKLCNSFNHTFKCCKLEREKKR